MQTLGACELGKRGGGEVKRKNKGTSKGNLHMKIKEMLLDTAPKTSLQRTRERWIDSKTERGIQPVGLTAARIPFHCLFCLSSSYSCHRLQVHRLRRMTLLPKTDYAAAQHSFVERQRDHRKKVVEVLLLRLGHR